MAGAINSESKIKKPGSPGFFFCVSNGFIEHSSPLPERRME
jgi:hypothetical protein